MTEMLGPEEDVSPPAWEADPAQQQRIREVYDHAQEPGSAISAQIAMDTDRSSASPHCGSPRHTGVPEVPRGCTDSLGAARLSEAASVLATDLRSPFVFDDFSLPMTKAMIGDDAPESLTAEMHGAWISFASKGDPAATGAGPTWPEYEPGSRLTMVFDEKTRLESDPAGPQRAAWDDVPLHD